MWLNDGSFLQIDESQQMLQKEYLDIDDDFLKLSKSCGRIFNILIENRSKVNEACEQYALAFKNTEIESGYFCSLCFELTKICYFTPSQRNIRPQLVELIKEIPSRNEDAELLSDLALHRISDFSKKYIERGGSQLALDQIISYNESNTVEKWMSELERVSKSFNKFDDHFYDLLLSKTVSSCCDDYLLSIFISNFLKNKYTTPDNLRKTAEMAPPPKSATDRILAAIIGFNFADNLTEAFRASQDPIFPVHFLHLLSLKSEENEIILRRDLDISILRFVELIVSDYDEQSQSGLRRWAPLYLKVVSEDVRIIVQKILPAVRLGLSGTYIQSVLELQNFANSEFVELSDLYQKYENLDEVLAKGDANDFEELVKEINEDIPSCDQTLKYNIYSSIQPHLASLEGLSSGVLSEFLEIALTTKHPQSKKRINELRNLEMERIFIEHC